MEKKSIIFISVIVCAHNSGRDIAELLECLASQDHELFEIIIVDNNSTDNTAHVVRQCIAALSDIHIRLITEPRPGKSHALNTGIASAKGEIIAFADDDVIVGKDWLTSVARAFENPDVAAMGGRIFARWDEPAPSWFTPATACFTPVHDFGDKVLSYCPPSSLPIGANMAVRKYALERVGLFDTSLGHVGNKKIGGEESDLCQRIYDLGMGVIYWPQAVVHHRLSTRVMTRAFMCGRIFTQGRVAAYYLKKNERSIFAMGRMLTRKKKNSGFAGREYALPSQKQGKNIFYYELKMILYLGYLYGLFFSKRAFL